MSAFRLALAPGWDWYRLRIDCSCWLPEPVPWHSQWADGWPVIPLYVHPIRIRPEWCTDAEPFRFADSPPPPSRR